MSVLFDPTAISSEKKTFKPLPEGTYACNVLEFQESKVDLTTKTGNVIDIIKPVLQVNGDKHEDFANQRIFANVFITKNTITEEGTQPPTERDNQSLYYFLDSVSYPMDTEEVVVEGTKKSAIVLPTADDEIIKADIVGKPVMVTTRNREYEKKDGTIGTDTQVRMWMKWENGEAIESSDSDLPF